jgi:hypothetical protein
MYKITKDNGIKTCEQVSFLISMKLVNYKSRKIYDSRYRIIPKYSLYNNKITLVGLL